MWQVRMGMRRSDCGTGSIKIEWSSAVREVMLMKEHRSLLYRRCKSSLASPSL